ncbi:MAG: BrnT family toxin [Bryobacteraceae bacterium]
MRFEWNGRKAAANIWKHGIAFDEAASVFFDPLSTTGSDPDHSFDERRFVTFGLSSKGRRRPFRTSLERMERLFESSRRARQLGQRERFMKKTKKLAPDELRAEYKRSDSPSLVRGKYINRLRDSSNVVVIDPELADFFPNGNAVNAALRSLAEIARRTAHVGPGRAEPSASIAVWAGRGLHRGDPGVDRF